ncbi:MAG: hypothetical protein MUC38_08515 [Cyclobacteriaceae bacterium]|jgi:hypothetical protein|nr:hypothetical protein [Cyclobacteriaceae bacterium]
MESLKPDWLTSGLIDFEYKKYVLLGYLQRVRAAFGRVELYPMLSDLVFHYRNLVTLKENKGLMGLAFPKELTPEGVKNLELTYRKLVEDDAVMAELESILEFSLPRIKSSVEEGSEVYEYVETHCEISPVGLTPLYTHEGYFFVAQPPAPDTYIYSYQVTIFDQENSRGLHSQLIGTETKSLANSYEQMKRKLIKDHSALPNPCVYVIESKVKVPLDRTLVPIAKRLLIKYVSKAA